MPGTHPAESTMWNTTLPLDRFAAVRRGLRLVLGLRGAKRRTFLVGSTAHKKRGEAVGTGVLAGKHR